MKIYKNFRTAHDWEFIDLLNEGTWAGAQQRIKKMDDEEFKELLNYLDSLMQFDDENIWSITQLNDFIWFEWDDIYEKLKNGEE